ncbi:hypothetical protein CLV62_12246 [Dysgonomonas alginatilytica]|uniref:PKD domain-containing protein n=1 Tax=Dysgonomonas alginatilytica TaxID=1605892 RepID=A0A2V3PST1_9BACT|nr:PKD domain-containing protein [Dysgonomonas alginatilytica]PXV62091.1 hypothetical protein CLV62_12246 [Dysgonomonas alginatilytica]
MKKIVFLFLLAVSCFQAQAQKEAANWFFGSGCGLDFINTVTKNDASSVAVTDVPTNQSSPLSTYEGCFSLSDSDGRIIVFSDGMRVYNKDKALIASGLRGNSSSAQSGILIPWPEKPGFYFIISNAQSGTGSGGIFYSVFDAAGNSGNGLVTNINTALKTTGYVTTTNLYENVTSVKHDNGTDYWLLNRTGQYMFAWLITKNGFVNLEPTAITTIPGTVSTIPMVSEGYMKMSPDGKQICHANIDAPNGEVLLADFDNSTGKISNIKLRNIYPGGNSALGRIYGVEFSPSGKNMFISQLNGGLYVIPTAEFMTATPKLITSLIGIVQTGPDGRLYGIIKSGKRLGIIPNPEDDIPNIKIHLFENYLTGTAEWGLPTFVASFFNAKAVDKSFVCVGNDFKYTVEISMSGAIADQPTKLEWNFGDGSAKVNQTIVSGTTIYKQTHNYTATGKYNITITPYKSNGAALSPVTLPANVTDCIFRTNRMIRTDLLNTAQQK